MFPFDVIVFDPYCIYGCLDPNMFNVDTFRFSIVNSATLLFVDKLLSKVSVVTIPPIDDMALVISTILAVETDDIVEKICDMLITGPRAVEKLDIVE